MSLNVYKLRPEDDADGSGARGGLGGASAASDEDLRYTVEVGDAASARVVAISASGSIGFAAYYAAVREYPGQVVQLKERGRVISKSDAQRH